MAKVPLTNKNGAGMSEAMSKVEIEDVLSSIRRLVSEDRRPSMVRGGPSLERGNMTAGPDRLILTPALRVISPELMPELTADADPVMVAEAAEPVAPPIGSLVAGLGAAVDAQSEDWESETGDEPPPLPEGAAALDDSDWGEDEPRLTFAAYPRIQLINPIRPPSPPKVVEDPWSAPELPAANLPPVEAQAEQGALVEADILEQTELSIVPPEILAAPEILVAPEILATDEAFADSEIYNPLTDLPDWSQEGEDEPQDTLLHGASNLEPDEDWADAAEAEAMEELAGGIVHRIAADAHDTPDEQALRGLVREMIVEELQGQLGQRITRNIRKLVRAEIAKALATQDLY